MSLSECAMAPLIQSILKHENAFLPPTFDNLVCSLFSVTVPCPSLLTFYQPSSIVSSSSKQQKASLCFLVGISNQAPAMSSPNTSIRGTTGLSGSCSLQHSASNAYFSNMQLGSQLYCKSSIPVHRTTP